MTNCREQWLSDLTNSQADSSCAAQSHEKIIFRDHGHIPDKNYVLIIVPSDVALTELAETSLRGVWLAFLENPIGRFDSTCRLSYHRVNL